MNPIDVLMVEDNRGDVVLLREALAKAEINYRVTVVCDGIEALNYLRRQGRHVDAMRPELIILDLKLPRKSGREVLDGISRDAGLIEIPVVVFSRSRSELTLARSQSLPQRCFMVKPSTFAEYVSAAGSMETFRRTAASPQAQEANDAV